MSMVYINQSTQLYKNIKVDSMSAFDKDAKFTRNSPKKMVPIKIRTHSLINNQPFSPTDNHQSHLEFEISDPPNHIVVKVVDTNTGEIIRRIPNLESSPYENSLGNLLDEKV